MKPVSICPAMNASSPATRARNAALLLTGQTSTAAHPAARRRAAERRSGACAISLAIMGS